jgi:urease accessory protein
MTGTAAPSAPALLRAVQFADSMFPVGAFSFSNALESAVELGVVDDLASLREFVATAMQVAATGDGIAVLVAHRAARAGDAELVRRADEAVYQRKLNEELRTMTVRMGRKLAEASAHIVDDPVLRARAAEVAAGTVQGTYPVGLGVLFAVQGLPEQDAFAVHQHGVAVMVLGAALRLMRVRHLDAQAVLYELNQGVGEQYARVASAGLDDMATFAPVLDVLAAAHTKAHVRMFMN